MHAPDRVYNEGGPDPYMRGMLLSEGKPAGDALESGFSDSARSMLFQLNQKISTDIVALNIQRGREQGIRSYWDYRRCVVTCSYVI